MADAEYGNHDIKSLIRGSHGSNSDEAFKWRGSNVGRMPRMPSEVVRPLRQPPGQLTEVDYFNV